MKEQKRLKRVLALCCFCFCIRAGFQGCMSERIQNIVYRMKEEISLPTIEVTVVPGESIQGPDESVKELNEVVQEPDNSILVTETEEDIRVIPDKYNTGASGELTVVGLGDTVEGIQLKVDGTGNKNTMGFYYSNKTVSGTIVIENMDFSNYPLLLYHGDKIERTITLVFNNCKFSTVSTVRANSKVTCEFNHCTVQHFTGSDATFNRCKFGDSYSDGIVPFQNITVQDCFFSNMSVKKTEEGEVHSDGTQIYGYADVPVYNVFYENCRFEIPVIELTGSNAYVNACIMLQLEYADASNISVRNCILNGGGYSIYARTKTEEFTMENVGFQDIKVGCAKKYGTLYPAISKEVIRENISDTDSLYVASVWKENGQTYFSVTNDTNRERELLILTDKGQFSYRIPACPRGNDIEVDSRYEDLPFDLAIVVPMDCQYAICYDNFFSGAAEQIRFVNWSGEKVYLAEEKAEELFSGKGATWHSGQCGDDICYELDNEGCLILNGSGATYNFHSTKRAPWYEYREYIKQVIVEKGVTVLGSQIFKECSSLQNVTLSEGLVEIGSRAFDGCAALQEVYWPSSLQMVGKQAFLYQFLKSVQYEGTDISTVITDAEEAEKVLPVLKYIEENGAP